MPQATLKQKDVEFSNEYNPVELDTVVANKFGLPYGLAFGTLRHFYFLYANKNDNPFPFSHKPWMCIKGLINTFLPGMSKDEQLLILKKLKDENYIDYVEIDNNIIFSLSDYFVGEK